MKKQKYQTLLWQTNDTQGFLNGHGFLMALNIKSIPPAPYIIVEDTVNPFYVKEISTGMKIPVVFLKENDDKELVYTTTKNVHTFVVNWYGHSKENNNKNGLVKIDDSNIVHDYLWKYAFEDEWQKKLEEYFAVGYNLASIQAWETEQAIKERNVRIREWKKK